MSNELIRDTAKHYRVRFWEIAEALNIGETTLSRRMRRELPEVEQEKMLDLIATIAQSRYNVDDNN